MRECTGNRFKMMLHRYELGLLDDAEREQFELHLYTCDYCLEKVLKFQDAATLMRHDPAARKVIADAAEDIDTERSSAERSGSGRLWPRFIPASLATLALLIALIIQPWQATDHSVRELTAGECRVIVMPFRTDAVEDSLRWGEVLSGLVTADMSASDLAHVVPIERRYDVVKLLGIDPAGVVDDSLARTVADEAGATWMVTGSIDTEDSGRIATETRLVEVATGDTTAFVSITGTADDGIFDIVDSLTPLLVHHLSLPVGDFLKTDRPVTDVTTRSMDAYRRYIEGLDLLNRVYLDDARNSFAAAIALDSTFAMAYYQLSILGQFHLIEQAARFAQNATRREQMYISSRAAYLAQDFEEAARILGELVTRFPDEKEAYLLLGMCSFYQHRYEDAVIYNYRALALDSLYSIAYNQLAYSFERAGLDDSAIWAVNKYVALSPGDANAYDTRGDIYSCLGRLDDAIVSFHKALELAPGYPFTLLNLGLAHLYKGNLETADSIFRHHASINQTAGIIEAGLYRPVGMVLKGRFASAIEALDVGIRRDTLLLTYAELVPDHQRKHLLKMMLLAEMNEMDAAADTFERFSSFFKQRQPDQPIPLMHLYIQMLAEGGELPRATELASNLKASLDSAGLPLGSYHYARGVIHLQSGRASDALAAFAAVLSQRDDPGARFMLGRSLHEAGRLAEAAVEYEGFLSTYTREGALYCLYRIKSHYYLGRIYETQDNADAAVSHYETFIKLRGDAEKESAMVADAKQRLLQLTTGTR